MTLDNYPELFEKDTLIVVGEDATQIEQEASEAIAKRLKKLTGNKPAIRRESELSKGDRCDYNLVLVGTPNSNSLLQEASELSTATRVSWACPKESLGILELLENPWNGARYVLLVAGTDGARVEEMSDRLIDLDNLETPSLVVSDGHFQIELKSRTFVPGPGINKTLLQYLPTTAEAVHVFLQFCGSSADLDFESLQQDDIRLLGYISDNAWFASLPIQLLEDKSRLPPGVRWVGRIRPTDKINPDLLDKGPGEWAKNPDGTVKIKVSFFEDVPREKAPATIGKHQGRIEEEFNVSFSYHVSLPVEEIIHLAGEDAVEFIGFYPPPPTIDTEEGGTADE